MAKKKKSLGAKLGEMIDHVVHPEHAEDSHSSEEQMSDESADESPIEQILDQASDQEESGSEAEALGPSNKVYENHPKFQKFKGAK